MNPQQVLRFYESVLAAFDQLDRFYYSNPSPSADQLAAYNQRRREMMDALRDRLYRAIDGSDGYLAENPDTFRIVVNDGAGSVALSEPKCRLQHELKNCLHIILASTELLSSSVSDDAESLARIGGIARTVQRMKERINSSRCRIVQERSQEYASTSSQSEDKTTSRGNGKSK